MRFEIIDAFAKWLGATRASAMVLASPVAWPACETLHFIGLALLIGTVFALDLRMLGVFKGLSIGGLHRLSRWGIVGFSICFLTGLVFFVGAPSQYIRNPIFYLKLLAIVLAGVNALVFEFKILPEMTDLGPDSVAPYSAKLTAAVSIVLWICVMFFGRMLPFLGEAF
jgi:hypothetical protein